MHRNLTVWIMTGALAALAVAPGCTADVHDNTVTANVDLDHANVNVTSSSSSVSASSSVTLNLSVENGVVLVPPEQTPPPNQATVAAYFEIFIDDENGMPLVVTASTSVSVTIPASTPPGSHKLICRLHHHDGTPTQSVATTSITVSASAGGGGSVDAGSVDAGSGGGTADAGGSKGDAG